MVANSSVLTTVSSHCICPGHEAVFECTVDDGVTTIWQGSALENCSDGTVILRHSKFGEGHTINESCGTSGPVIGRAISAENGSYTSQLTISITQQIIGSIIECATDGEQSNSSDIQLRLSTGMGTNLNFNDAANSNSFIVLKTMVDCMQVFLPCMYNG